MSDENCRPPMENLINYSALCQTPPSYSDSDPNILPGLESLVCSDNGQKSVLRINNELINNYFLMLSQTQQPQQPLASLNQLHVLQKIAPFVSTALTGFRAVPVRLKVLIWLQINLLFTMLIT